MTRPKDRCRSCNAEVIWIAVRTPTGSKTRLPVNARRVRSYERDTDDGTWFTPPEPVYVSHFVTCPDADSWSKNAPATDGDRR